MVCLKIIRRHWICSIFVFSLFSLFSVFGLSQNSYALNDLVFDFSSNPTTFQTICADNSSFTDGSICGYRYFLINSTDISSGDAVILIFSIGESGSGYYTLGNQYSSSTLYDFTSFPSGAFNIQVRSASSFNHTITVTLSENNPFSGSSSEPEDCPVCPEIPENPYDNKLDDIKKAIYCCGAILIMLYFFFCIYKIIVKDGGSR
jgi:hypothetical protein